MQKTMSIKLIVIIAISLLLLLPLNMISGKIQERFYFQESAKQSVAESWTNAQTITGAFLAIRYTVKHTEDVVDPGTQLPSVRTFKKRKIKFIVPESLHVDSVIENTVRHKGIYTIPVYNTDLSFTGTFSAAKLKREMAAIAQTPDLVEIEPPYLSLMVSDPRGINSIPQLNWQQNRIAFQPGSNIASNSQGMHALLPDLTTGKDGDVTFSFDLSVRGMEALAFVPIAANISVKATSAWPHPQFTGAFLPIKSEISDNGYSASWKATSFATNIFEKVTRCEESSCDALQELEFGVKHIETVDIYLLSERSVKYGFLFIGLSFIAFFIFEVLMKLPIHPIQYALVGAANAIFYLLLISLSEHYPFLVAYLVASVCCSLLLFFYLKVILRGGKFGAIFAGAISLLYSVLYVIISMEDLALMMGSFLTFIALTITMFATRNIDWYAVGSQFQEMIEKDSAKENS